MADLAAPFVALVPDDVEAFWCFERLMRHSRANFAHSGEGVRAQLRMLGRVLEHKDPVLMHHLRHVGAGECLFAYRMVLVLMRRELSLANVRQAPLLPPLQTCTHKHTYTHIYIHIYTYMHLLSQQGR